MGFFIAGLIFVGLGIRALMWAGKRAFERRNAAGVEEFKSYGAAVGSTAVEAVAKTAAVLSILIGLFMFLMAAAWHSH